MFSPSHHVLKLSLGDTETVYAFCQGNPQYYEYCGEDISPELIEHDLKITPPGIPLEQKYYVGFFDGDRLSAIMDLIAGYPDESCVFIGFFMVAGPLQGKGIGSRIISHVLDYARSRGFKKCRLGIDKSNPQSDLFWRKNGFEVIQEVPQGDGIILLAERTL